MIKLEFVDEESARDAALVLWMLGIEASVEGPWLLAGEDDGLGYIEFPRRELVDFDIDELEEEEAE